MSSAAIRAHVHDQITQAGVPVSSDPSTFFPDPIGALIGPITRMEARTLDAFTVVVPVHVVSTAQLDDELANALFDAARSCTVALGTGEFTLDGWQTSANTADLPAYLIEAIISWKD